MQACIKNPKMESYVVSKDLPECSLESIGLDGG